MLEVGEKVAVLSLHWQIITFYSEKQNLEILLLQLFIVIYLFINNINVFKHLCVCVATCVHVLHKN